MTALQERLPELPLDKTSLLNNQLHTLQFPLHPIDEDPSELVSALLSLTLPDALTIKGIVRMAAVERHQRALEQSVELEVSGIPQATVEVPRAVVVPHLIGQDTMSALGISRALLQRELHEHPTDRSKMLLTRRK